MVDDRDTPDLAYGVAALWLLIAFVRALLKGIFAQ